MTIKTDRNIDFVLGKGKINTTHITLKENEKNYGTQQSNRQRDQENTASVGSFDERDRSATMVPSGATDVSP